MQKQPKEQNRLQTCRFVLYFVFTNNNNATNNNTNKYNFRIEVGF